MGTQPRCRGCKVPQKMATLSSKVVVAIDENGKKQFANRTVGCVCWECMTVEVVNPYTSDIANFRETTPMDRAWAILKRGGV